MKKLITILLAMAMLFTLAACGENGGSSSGGSERRAGEGERADQNTPDPTTTPPRQQHRPKLQLPRPTAAIRTITDKPMMFRRSRNRK